MRCDGRYKELKPCNCHYNLLNLRTQLSAVVEAGKDIEEYLSHERECILTMWQAGEPTLNGGYRIKYAGKWYQKSPVDETPKCDCGLDELFENWRKVTSNVPEGVGPNAKD